MHYTLKNNGLEKLSQSWKFRMVELTLSGMYMYLWTSWKIAVKNILRFILTLANFAQKIKFSVKDFFSKCVQVRSFFWIWSHLLKKFLMEISYLVFDVYRGYRKRLSEQIIAWNVSIFRVFLVIVHPKCGNMWSGKNPNADQFPCSEWVNEK